MVWPGGDGSSGSEEIPRHPMRPGMRPGFFPYPRRGLHMRAGFFPPRPFHPAQNFINPRKVRPPWVPRPRPPPPPMPHFMPGLPAPPESFLPFPPQPPWPQPPPPQPPPPEAQIDPDTYVRTITCKTQPVFKGTRATGGPLQGPSSNFIQTSENTNRKKKRKSANGSSKPWDKKAAERAHALELECQRSANAKSIVIRFPDPELSKEIVQNFHSAIDNVHFQGPCGARYCFVTLKNNAKVEKVMEDINKIKFGTGHLNAERKVQKPEENASYDNIDPYTLYVGNLALNITVSEVKEKFPSAARIDVGHAKKMKNTRYAFVKFATAEAALEAYRESVNTIMASRSIIVRFRRHKATLGPPGEKPPQPETKPGERLTVGAKLKAKKEKAAKEAAEAKTAPIVIKDEVESEPEVELENEDDFLSEYEAGDLEQDAEEDDDELENIPHTSDSEDYVMSDDDFADTDDDDQLVNNPTKDEDDEYYEDEDECKDVFSFTFNKR